jgi:hypothetical protein
MKARNEFLADALVRSAITIGALLYLGYFTRVEFNARNRKWSSLVTNKFVLYVILGTLLTVFGQFLLITLEIRQFAEDRISRDAFSFVMIAGVDLSNLAILCHLIVLESRTRPVLEQLSETVRIKTWMQAFWVVIWVFGPVSIVAQAAIVPWVYTDNPPAWTGIIALMTGIYGLSFAVYDVLCGYLFLRYTLKFQKMMKHENGVSSQWKTNLIAKRGAWISVTSLMTAMMLGVFLVSPNEGPGSGFGWFYTMSCIGFYLVCLQWMKMKLDLDHPAPTKAPTSASQIQMPSGEKKSSGNVDNNSGPDSSLV